MVAVCSQVTQFQPGDPVYGDLSKCGFGGFAAYVCAPGRALTLRINSTSLVNTVQRKDMQ